MGTSVSDVSCLAFRQAVQIKMKGFFFGQPISEPFIISTSSTSVSSRSPLVDGKGKKRSEVAMVLLAVRVHIVSLFTGGICWVWQPQPGEGQSAELVVAVHAVDVVEDILVGGVFEPVV